MYLHLERQWECLRIMFLLGAEDDLIPTLPGDNTRLPNPKQMLPDLPWELSSMIRPFFSNIDRCGFCVTCR